MPPPGAFEPEDWREAQARIAHALDKLRTDRKQQRELTRQVAEHALEALECAATREQIADALGMSEHASPQDPADLAADVSDLGTTRGHRTLTVARKGGRRVTMPLAPATVTALDPYLAGRTTGPLFQTRTGRRLDQPAAFRLVRRLAKAAGVENAERLSPHSLRHGAITAALDAGVSLRDVQDFAGHVDPRTTRRYDRAEYSLDRHATYAVAAYFTAEA